MTSVQSAKGRLLEEVSSEEFQPTKDEIIEYAKTIGINPEKEPILLNIAEEGIKASLPSNWEVYEDENKHIYFYNKKTQESTWNHPMDYFYRQKVEKERRRLVSDKVPVPAPRRSSVHSQSPADPQTTKEHNSDDERRILYKELRKELQSADFGLHKKMFSLEAKSICDKTIDRFIAVAQSRFESKYKHIKAEYETKIADEQKKYETEMIEIKSKAGNHSLNGQDSSLASPSFLSKEDLKQMNLTELTLESNRIDKRIRRLKQLYRDYKSYSAQISRQLAVLESTLSIDFSADALVFQTKKLSITDQNSQNQKLPFNSTRRESSRGSFIRSSSLPRAFNSSKNESRGRISPHKINDLSVESESADKSLSYHQVLVPVRPSLGVSPNNRPNNNRDSDVPKLESVNREVRNSSSNSSPKKTQRISYQKSTRLGDSNVGVFGTQFDSPLESVVAENSSSRYTRYNESPLHTGNGSSSSGRGSSSTAGFLSFSSLY